MTVETKFINTARHAQGLFKQYCAEATDIWIACAWATESCPCTDVLWQARSKVRALVVGLTFLGTDPAFLHRYEPIKTARVFSSTGEAIFHPKVYLFKKGRRFQCLVGSSNFTRSGFGGNVEANIAMEGTIGAPIFKNVHEYVSSLFEEGHDIGPLLRDYEAQYRRARLSEVPRYVPSKAVTRVLAQKKVEAAKTNSAQLQAALRQLPEGDALARIARTLVDAIGRHQPTLTIQWNPHGFTITTSLPGFLVRLAILEVHKTYARIQIVHGLAHDALYGSDSDLAKKFYEDASLRISSVLPQARSSKGQALWGLPLLELKGDEQKLTGLLAELAASTARG